MMMMMMLSLWQWGGGGGGGGGGVLTQLSDTDRDVPRRFDVGTIYVLSFGPCAFSSSLTSILNLI